MNNVSDNYRIVKFCTGKDKTNVCSSFEPEKIERMQDGELFSIGDIVTNGQDSPMVGAIQRFQIDNDDIYVYTSYSGVGMNMSSISKVVRLPCKYQMGEKVSVSEGVNVSIKTAVVIAVHFYKSKVKYDIDVWMDKFSTRFYNVDEFILKPI